MVCFVMMQSVKISFTNGVLSPVARQISTVILGRWSPLAHTIIRALEALSTLFLQVNASKSARPPVAAPLSLREPAWGCETPKPYSES